MPRARTLRVGLFVSPTSAAVQIQEDVFTAAAAQTVFTPLTHTVATGGWSQLSINGQDVPKSDYNAVGTTLTYVGSLAVVAGDKFVVSYEYA